jgi:hypothetical protein
VSRLRWQVGRRCRGDDHLEVLSEAEEGLNTPGSGSVWLWPIEEASGPDGGESDSSEEREVASP